MSELRDRGSELLAAGAYRHFVTQRYGELREQAAARFAADGVTEQRIVGTDGTYLGMLSVGDPTIIVTITDEDAMLDYMAHVHPNELLEITTYVIRDAFWGMLVAASRKAGHGVDPTRENEPLKWIRVEVKPGELRVTPSSAARERVQQIMKQRGTGLELES